MKEGDSCTAGDAICEIETDKASMAFEVQDDFYIAKILVEAGKEVKVGSPVFVSVENQGDVAAFANFVAPLVDATEAPAVSAPVSLSAPVANNATTHSVSVSGSGQRFAPSARHMVESQAISTNNLVGTSRHGLISKADVILGVKAGTATVGTRVVSPASTGETSAAVSSPSAAAAAPFDLDSFLAGLSPVNDKYTDIPNTNMRKVIARRLTESKATVPHVYATIECELDNLLALRKTFQKDLNTNVSVNDMVIKAAALALRDLPDVRCKWDNNTQSVTAPGDVDISVAVATPNGLITPIVTNADKRGCSDINAAVKDLAGRAKINKLMPEEYTGGCFSISNLGMFGISSFSAVINPPQACILAVGAGIPRMMPPLEGQTKPRTATILSVQLSADRRVVDEALASQFLEVFSSYMSNPKTILL